LEAEWALLVFLVTAKAALEEFERAVAAGDGEKDVAAAVEQLRNSHFEN
jgi:hypothetical protein